MMEKIEYFGSFLCISAMLWLVAHGRSIDELIEDAGSLSALSLGDRDTEDKVLVEMDMAFTPEQWQAIQEKQDRDMHGRYRRKALTDILKRWTNKTVPVEIEVGDFTASELEAIDQGINEWNNYTCLNIQNRTDEVNYVNIIKLRGCWSYVGMVGGAQNLSIGDRCGYKRVVVHELGHAIGYYHEQSRWDRYRYIQLVPGNIRWRRTHNFRRYSYTYASSYNVPYDYASVMHYGERAFSKNYYPTILTKDRTWQFRIGRAQGLSFADIKLANIIYNCGEHCNGKTCPGSGYLDKTCTCQCKGAPIQKCASCIDRTRSCSLYARLGYCAKDRYEGYMTRNCRKSCRLC